MPKPEQELPQYSNQNIDADFEFDLFLSFSSRNIDSVYEMYEVFQRYHLRVFISEITLKSDGGTSFFDKINHALNHSKHFVLLCTPESMQSQWVKTEFQAFYHNFTMQNPDTRKFFVMRGPGFHHSLVPLLLSVIQLVDSAEQIIRSLNIKPVKAIEPDKASPNLQNEQARLEAERKQQAEQARLEADRKQQAQKLEQEARLKQQAEDNLKALQQKAEQERQAEQLRQKEEEQAKQLAKTQELERQKQQREAQKAADLRKQQAQEQQKEQIELKLWQTALDSNALPDFKFYLQKHPKGKFATEAKQFIAVLEQNQPTTPLWIQYKKPIVAVAAAVLLVLLVVVFKNVFNGSDAKEDTVANDTTQEVTKPSPEQIAALHFDSLSSTFKLQSLREYLKTNEAKQLDEKYKQKANNLLSQLISDSTEYVNNEELRQADEAAWTKTSKKKTKAAYEQYLKEFENGLYASDARVALEKLAWEKAKSENSTEAYTAYKTAYPNGTYLKEANTAIADNKKREANLSNLNFEMVYIKGGTFTMGNEDEKSNHTVTLSDFYIGKYEVTQAQWKAVMGTNPSNFKGDNLPVENVSWDDIQEFIKKLNAATGKKYSLPTEAQWEYAAGGHWAVTHGLIVTAVAKLTP